MARKTLAERFWRAVDRSGNACWEWTKALHNPQRYGKIDVDGKWRYAHRVSWQLTHGKIPDGLWVLHRCDNPPCVNPSHLFLGTPRDNTRDCMAKGRKSVRRGVAASSAKLTDADVAEIRKALARHETQVSIAMRYGITQ